ncbi:MAG: isoprenylcysteine carboxylmethyltransferase family protein [Bacteroidales bacterium]|nr:isoprenylcysteine carboxylmethyltransferase family protein [Bacteroidales bacterium]
MIFRLIIWVLFIFGGVTLGIFLDLRYFQNIWFSWQWHMISFLWGVFLLKIVMTISKNTGRILAKHGRKGNLPRMETNQLVKEGPYGCMRHPMHLGLFLFPMAFAFLSGSLSFILIITPSEIVLMLIMIFIIEEPEAIRKFGDQYLEYRKQVPAFSFRWVCLKALLKPVSKQ